MDRVLIVEGDPAGPLEEPRTKEACGVPGRPLHDSFSLRGLLGNSGPMSKLHDDIGKAASADANVLILGESGAGKERVSRMVHGSGSRRTGAFLPINCAAIPESLLEAELFGYERGAFTGAQVAKDGLLEAADGGTLFLDEVCELNPLLQAKLLRAVEEGTVRRVGGIKPIPVDVRFIASTNRDIYDEMRRGRFREDLFFRLDVIEIRVPPLRERREDIPLLAAHFLESCVRRYGKKVDGCTDATLGLLTRYDWPGNVRELRSAVERAVAYAQGPLIAPEDLPEAVLTGAQRQDGYCFHAWRKKTLARLEKEFLKKALEEHGGCVSDAAKALGIHRSTLQRLMRRHNLPAWAAA
jgi:transcriptional regulator with PAS, ATPase and Fis domain